MKRLSYEVVKHDWQGIHIRITEQTHKRDKFGSNNECYFTSSNGFKLISDCWPAADNCFSMQIHVRGSYNDQDNQIIVIKKQEQYEDFEQSVKEYNEKYFNKDASFFDEYQEDMDKWFDRFIHFLQDGKNELKGISTIDGAMSWKKNLLFGIIDEMPLSAENCLYCLINSFEPYGSHEECKKCDYGKDKGICNQMSTNNTYGRIMNKLREFRNELKNYY